MEGFETYIVTTPTYESDVVTVRDNRVYRTFVQLVPELLQSVQFVLGTGRRHLNILESLGVSKRAVIVDNAFGTDRPSRTSVMSEARKRRICSKIVTLPPKTLLITDTNVLAVASHTDPRPMSAYRLTIQSSDSSGGYSIFFEALIENGLPVGDHYLQAQA